MVGGLYKQGKLLTPIYIVVVFLAFVRVEKLNTQELPAYKEPIAQIDIYPQKQST